MSLIDEIARGYNREITERNTRIAVLLRRVADLQAIVDKLPRPDKELIEFLKLSADLADGDDCPEEAEQLREAAAEIERLRAALDVIAALPPDCGGGCGSGCCGCVNRAIAIADAALDAAKAAKGKP